MGFLCIMSCALMIYCCDPHDRVTEILDPVEPKAAVVFLHGAGESGPKVKEMASTALGGFSNYPNLRLIFPTAKPKTLEAFPWSGHPLNLWYGMDSISLAGKENEMQIEEEAKYLMKLIDQQVASGIPHNKICVVGFSIGGCMALHIGYDYVKDLACVGAIAGFLPTNSTLLQKLGTGSNQDLPPLYMSAGQMDFLIRPSWSKETAAAFSRANVEVSFRRQWHIGHFLSKSDLRNLFSFVQESVGLEETDEIDSEERDLTF